MASRPLKFRGVDYQSQAAAADAYGLQRAAISYRTRHLGETPEAALEALVRSGIAEAPTRRGRCRVGSTTFANAAVAAKHFGLDPVDVSRLMRSGKYITASMAITQLLSINPAAAKKSSC